jgi:hypothetical protein
MLTDETVNRPMERTRKSNELNTMVGEEGIKRIKVGQ